MTDNTKPESAIASWFETRRREQAQARAQRLPVLSDLFHQLHLALGCTVELLGGSFLVLDYRGKGVRLYIDQDGVLLFESYTGDTCDMVSSLALDVAQLVVWLEAGRDALVSEGIIEAA